jgi:hypothetical protein
MLKITLGFLLAVGFAVVIFLRNANSDARTANEVLQRDQAETVQLMKENQSISEIRDKNTQIDGLRNSRQELLKLRNEVRQLRAQGSEVEKLRQENQRLACRGNHQFHAASGAGAIGRRTAQGVNRKLGKSSRVPNSRSTGERRAAGRGRIPLAGIASGRVRRFSHSSRN